METVDGRIVSENSQVNLMIFYNLSEDAYLIFFWPIWHRWLFQLVSNWNILQIYNYFQEAGSYDLRAYLDSYICNN